ncbi:hypothetical protein RP20_CCG001359 [Aedes albopictus]|nr:hypothetical protein RP20_CCG001359 [Aedes albopictus]
MPTLLPTDRSRGYNAENYDDLYELPKSCQKPTWDKSPFAQVVARLVVKQKRIIVVCRVENSGMKKPKVPEKVLPHLKENCTPITETPDGQFDK